MIWSAFAPTSASHAPIVITAIRNADASSRRMTTARVALDEAFARFGCSISMSGSAIVACDAARPGVDAIRLHPHQRIQEVRQLATSGADALHHHGVAPRGDH